MTLKHIDFFDSPVMRELARQAIKKGTIEPTVEDMVKTASIKKETHAPTGDLFRDMVVLATGLRNKGYVHEAQSLEAKLLAYKKATDEYNSELSAAHPDGDIEMGDASNGLGDVETLESQHKKIVDVVNKKPTGKLAAILSSVEDALGLTKKAAPPQSQGPNVPAPAAGGDLDSDSPDDIFSGQSAARQSAVKDINTLVKNEFAKVLSILRGNDTDPSKWGFSAAQLYENPSIRGVYATYAQIDPATMDHFFKTQTELYGSTSYAGDQPGKIASTLNAYAKAHDVNSMISYANLVGGGIGTKYFSGSQPDEDKRKYLAENPEAANDPRYRDNPNSAWKWTHHSIHNFLGAYFDIDMNRILSASQEMQSVQYAQHTQLFGDARIKAASTALVGEIKKIVDPYQEVMIFFSQTPELPSDARSNASLIMSVNTEAEILAKNYGANSEGLTKLAQLGGVFWPGWKPNIGVKAEEARKAIAAIVSTLNSKPLSAGDSIVQDSSQASDLLMAAAKMHWVAAKKAPQNSQAHKNFVQNQNATFNLARKVQAASGKPYAALFEQLKGVFPKATTYDKLVQEAQTWLNESSQMTGVPAEAVAKASSEMKGIEKTADDTLVRAPQAGGAGSASPAPAAGGAAPHSKISGEEKDAVQGMQFSLMRLGQYVQQNPSVFPNSGKGAVPILIQTGKGDRKVDMDGAWGPNTTKALAKAQELLTEWNANNKEKTVGGTIQPAQMMYKGPAAVAAANANTTTLNALILAAYGQDLGGATNQAVAYGAVNGKTIMSTDLLSLQSLYKYFVKNGVLTEQSVVDEQGGEPTIGVQYLGFVTALQSIVQTAQNAYARVKSQLNARFYQDAINRWRDLVSVADRFGITAQNPETLLPYNVLPGGQGSGAGSASGTSGSSGHGGQGGGRGGAGYKGEVDEGQEYGSPGGRAGNSLPINPTTGDINIASPWYGQLRQQFGIKWGVLNYDTFSSETAPQLARILFPGSNTMLQDYFRFITAFRNAIDNAIGNWINRYKPNEAAQRSMMEWEQAWFQFLDNHENQLGAKTPRRL